MFGIGAGVRGKGAGERGRGAGVKVERRGQGEREGSGAWQEA